MLVSGAGDIKLTKDGNVLLQEMSIQHPTAALIARSATAVDEVVGDGTTSQVVLVGEILRQCERPLAEGVHPRHLALGLDDGRNVALRCLDQCRVQGMDRERLVCVARAALRTKLEEERADELVGAVVEAVGLVAREGRPVDLHMVEVMTMQHRTKVETKLVRGLVMDHGGRHPQMPRRLHNAYVLTLNVSLEYEKTEVNSEAVYSTAEERDKLVVAERKFIDDRVRRIIDLKRTVCPADGSKTFLVVNQKGIDPPALDMLAKEGILALRRAKRRNMERLTLACGGQSCNSVDDLHPSVLGEAEDVWEQVVGEEKYTFVEGVRNCFSCTVLVKAPTRHQLEQLKDAVRDGLRAVKNAMQDGCVVPGGGAAEVLMSNAVKKEAQNVAGRQKMGMEALAEALLAIPKALAQNAGHDAIDAVMRLQQSPGMGLDLASGMPMDPAVEGVWDLYRAKRQILHSATVLASQLLLVDEILKATGPGRQ